MKYLFKNSEEIYSINYKSEEIIEYKKEKIKTILEEDRILTGISLDNNSQIAFKNDRLYINIEPNKIKTFYLYKSKIDKDTKDNILNLYYFDKFNNLKAYKSNYFGETKYYLIDIPETIKNKERKSFGCIIQVPKELYYLQLFLNEEYDLLKGINIDEILKLFFIHQLDDEEIKRGNGRHKVVTNSNIDEISKKSKEHSKIIKKITRK